MGVMERIEAEAKKMFVEAKPTHDWDHIKRVLHLVRRMGAEAQADLQILTAAALLHDIGRVEADKSGECHAEKGAEMAEGILEKCDFPSEKRKAVIHCIRSHRFRDDNVPKTLEAKILYDADKLDAIGAIGICRAYSYAGENGQRLYSDFEEEVRLTKVVDHSEHTPVVEFKVKLSHIKDKMLTPMGRKLAEERHKYMVSFFERLKREIEGEL